ALYVYHNDSWIYIGGVIDQEAGTVTAESELSPYLDENNKAVFAIMGVLCLYCYESKLEMVYEPPFETTNAVILVHGLGSSPDTYQALIDDIRLTEQPFKLYTFGYPSSRSIQEIAVEFADSLEANTAEFDNIYIVGHSMGGLVAQSAVYTSYLKNQDVLSYRFLDKVKKMILVGVPNEGTPIANLYSKVYDTLVNSDNYPLFNLNSKLVKELAVPNIVPRVPGIKYYALAGQKDIALGTGAFAVGTKSIFGEDADGFVGLSSATNIGGEVNNELCQNFWLIDSNHFGLLDDPAARQTIARIISADMTSQSYSSIFGYNNYFDFDIASCSSKDTYFIIGKKIPKEAALDLTGCLCGNGVCGEGEDAVNCPVDCVEVGSRLIVISISTLLILILILILLLIGSFVRYEYNHLVRHRPNATLEHFLLNATRYEDIVERRLKTEERLPVRLLGEVYFAVIAAVVAPVRWTYVGFRFIARSIQESYYAFISLAIAARKGMLKARLFGKLSARWLSDLSIGRLAYLLYLHSARRIKKHYYSHYLSHVMAGVIKAYLMFTKVSLSKKRYPEMQAIQHFYKKKASIDMNMIDLIHNLHETEIDILKNNVTVAKLVHSKVMKEYAKFVKVYDKGEPFSLYHAVMSRYKHVKKMYHKVMFKVDKLALYSELNKANILVMRKDVSAAKTVMAKASKIYDRIMKEKAVKHVFNKYNQVKERIIL
ncbi:MAG: alpha/beta hydrolase, partial [Nanoarchaeota archaeon]|nr:alpha/beta hydrolase [Nanoarchaeota archaeon]